jgi:hypothetical protein
MDLATVSNYTPISWACDKGHTFISTKKSVYAAFKKGTPGCPYCSNCAKTVDRLTTLAPALLEAATKGDLTGAQLWPIVTHLSGGSPGLAQALKRLVKDRERNPTASVATLLSQQPSAAEDDTDQPRDQDDTDLDVDAVEQIVQKQARRPEDARAAIESIEQQVKAADPEAELHLNQFIVASLCAGYWADYCRHESTNNRDQLTALVSSLRATDSTSLLWGAVATKFLQEHDAAAALPIPKGFQPRGKDRRPLVLSMMQRLAAYHMTQRQRFGNWSAPGAGKTIAALYAAALLKSKLTLIIAPLSVIENAWVPQIKQCFSRSSVQGTTQKLTWTPDDETTHLCLNYDRLQSDSVADAIKKFAAEHGHRVGLIVFDECHRLKNDGKTGQGSAAKRHDAARLLLDELPHAKLLVQTGTPVLTGVAEGIALLEMIEPGITEARKLQRRNSIAGALDLHTAYTLHGVRFRPDYGVAVEQPQVKVNGSTYYGGRHKRTGEVTKYDVVGSLPTAELPLCELDDATYKKLNEASQPWQSWLAIERVLTPVRIPAIVAACKPRTVVYSHNTGSSSKDPLIDSIAKAIGKRYRCAVLDGRNPADRAAIIAKYKQGDIDVLVCSSVLGEGVDGLQDIGSRLVINCPPWTDGAYDQLVARWLRTGQKNTVQVVIPLTHHTRPDGLRVSLDVDRLARIGHRASIADAVLDGTIPATFISESALRDRAIALLSDA